METTIYSCRTDGCARQRQPGVARWCEGCGLPTAPDPEAAAGALPLSGAATADASRAAVPPPVTGLHGRTSGILALVVVVVLGGIVLVSTAGMYGGGGSGTAAGYRSADPYTYPGQAVAPPETVAEPTTQWTPPTEPAPTDPAPTEPPPTVPPEPVELAPDVDASASATARDNVDGAGNRTSYTVSNVLDADASTAWRTRGDGEGVTLTLTLPGRFHLTEVGLIPGYAKVDPANGRDRFREERRIRTVRWRFDDGSAVEQEFTDDPTMQRTPVDVATASVVIEIVATTEPGDEDYDYTAVSDVSLLGTEPE